LQEASRLIDGERDRVYGDPRTNHERIAALQSVTTGTTITPATAAINAALIKLSRLVHTPDHIDSFVDACAYLAIACEIATEGKDQ
jgi:hypothetical protein